MSRGKPPSKSLLREPEIARYLSTYNVCKALGCLPDGPALNDQDTRFVDFAMVFAQAEAEHQRNQDRKGATA